MKKIFTVLLLIILSSVIGNGTPDAGLYKANADTPVGGDGGDGASSSWDAPDSCDSCDSCG